MIIGFTGTQKGMTTIQKDKLRRMLSRMRVTHLHHGDCVGADTEAHKIGKELGLNLVIHPPDNDRKRAYNESEFILPEKPYLERNKDIVDSSDCIIACPKSNKEEIRSGTWATVRYARKQHKKIIILSDEKQRSLQ